MVQITPARFPQDRTAVEAIFREYAESLNVDLSFQDFEAELAALPGKFAPPAGQILLARDGDVLVGCVAFRPSEGDICEMKRLYVRPAGRGQQLGRQLAREICRAAKAAGYKTMRLDTIPSLQAAIGLYTSLGFKPVAPYIYNPLPGVMFMARSIDDID